jgi:hypothetical protein
MATIDNKIDLKAKGFPVEGKAVGIRNSELQELYSSLQGPERDEAIAALREKARHNPSRLISTSAEHLLHYGLKVNVSSGNYRD